MTQSHYSCSSPPPPSTHFPATQVQAFRAAYEDSERTHALRSQSEAALKAELHQLRVGGGLEKPVGHVIWHYISCVQVCRPASLGWGCCWAIPSTCTGGAARPKGPPELPQVQCIP